jgi:hypothetical protein
MKGFVKDFENITAAIVWAFDGPYTRQCASSRDGFAADYQCDKSTTE